MVNGLQTSAASMMNLLHKQEITSNNLANVNSTGFKMARLLTRAEVKIQRNDENDLHQDESQKMDEVHTSFAQGPLVQTDNNLDFALTKGGFFAIQTAEGTRYTRTGSFSLNAEGDLVTLNGDYILMRGGNRVNMAGAKTLSVTPGGGVFIDGVNHGELALADFQDTTKLLARGKGYFENTDPLRNPANEDGDFGIKQGYLEGSNVNMIGSMVDMISQFRNYEASQRVLYAIDDTLGKAVNDVGRVT